MATVIEARWFLFDGVLLTIKLFLVSAAFVMAVALLSGLAKLAPSIIIRSFAVGFTEVFRGTSLVVQLFWLYYALPFLGITLDTFWAASIGLGLCFGAYGSEIVRGAIVSVPHNQIDAAIALNMTPSHRTLRVVFPQALLAMLPPFGNLLILLLKGTSTASLIAFPELTFQASSVNYQAQATLEIFTVVLVVYFILAQLIAAGVRFAERALGAWRRP
jgi:polar amino acid transport system permease protein